MEYQSPEVKNLNTPVPTGLNDYVWQHNYDVGVKSFSIVP